MERSEPARILVVDDEERMCDSLDALLTRAGYRVQTAGDAESALRLFRANDFDLVISDIKLPEMDGIELLQAVRARDPQAMVILMTAYASLDTALAAINQGAYDYLLKPIEFTQLNLATKRALEKRELEKARIRLLAELHVKNDLLNRRIAEVDALYKAGVTLSQAQELNVLLTEIIELALSVIGANVGSVMLLDAAKGELTISASVGLSEELRKATRVKVGDSIAGFVAQTGEPLLVTDIRSDPRFARFGKTKYETNSLISVPLKIKDRVLGVLNLSDPRHGTVFEENDLRLLVTFASQAAVAIDDAENLRRLNKRLNELATLYELATQLTTVENAQQMTDLIYRSLKRIVKLDFTAWLLWNERTQRLNLAYWEGFGKEHAGALLGNELPLAGRAIYSAEHRIRTVRELICEIPQLRDSVKSFTAVPIMARGSLHGLFCLGALEEDAFSESDEYIASIVASQANSIYEQQRSVLNATRLVTMGKMVSEICHDLKRPLTNVSGALQLMRERWPEIAQADDTFHVAQHELARLTALSNELRDFAKPDRYQHEPRSVPELIRRVRRLIDNDLKKHKIVYSESIPTDIPQILANENQMVELLLNLIINAVEAMPEGGSLSISASVADGEEDNQQYVVLEVTDTGAGVPPEIQSKIFERYYTTKETGTGLGLAICERIVKSHNGSIHFHSEAEMGSTFTIRLPAA